MNKRIRKKHRKRCRRCRSYVKLYNGLCTACGRELFRQVYKAGSAYVDRYKGTERCKTAYIQDSRGVVWIYTGKGACGGWRSNLGAFSERLLEPWMIWFNKLTFEPYIWVDKPEEG